MPPLGEKAERVIKRVERVGRAPTAPDAAAVVFEMYQIKANIIRTNGSFGCTTTRLGERLDQPPSRVYSIKPLSHHSVASSKGPRYINIVTRRVSRTLWLRNKR